MTITGSGSRRSNPVIKATSGQPNTIHSNDLFIKATAVNGSAITSPLNNSGDVINLTGKGTVIGNCNHVTAEDGITFLGASAGELDDSGINSATEKSVFTCGSGYAVYDPASEPKTLLLQDATISNDISIDDIAVTIKGSLTVAEGKELNLETPNL